MQSSIEIQSLLSPLDWAVFALVLLFTFLAIFWGQSRRRLASSAHERLDFVEYLIMGRRLTLPLFVATLVATWYGGIFGVTRIAFESGIYNFLTQGIFWYLSYLIFAFFLLRHLRKYDALTLPELVGQMFGPKSARVAAIFNFFNVLPIAYAISLGMFAQALFGGSLIFNMSIGLALVVAYSFWGGFRAVVYSDLIQFSVMVSAVILVALFSIGEFGGLSFLRESLPGTHFEWLGGHSIWETLVWGFIALSTLVDPNFYQRCFAAKSDATARWGILVSTGIWIVFDLSTTAGALYARALIPEADPGFAYVVYAVQLLPEGLRGFFLAGLLATILSTIDSYLFIAGSTLSYDLRPKTRKLGHIRWSLLFVALLSLSLALIFEGNIRLVWKTLGTYFASCLLFPVLFGYCFPGRLKDSHFVYACVVSAGVVTVWRFLDIDFPALYPGLVTSGFLVSGAAFLDRKR